MDVFDHCPAISILSNDTPAVAALEVDADLQLWAANVSRLIPLYCSVIFTHLARVLLVAGPCGFL